MLRIWPRACQISKGIAGLRFLLKGDNKHQLDLRVSQMKYIGLNDVVDQLQVYVRGRCSTMEGILRAMAADIGKASGNDLERVCIWLHVDEHQLRYDAVKSALKWRMTNRQCRVTRAFFHLLWMYFPPGGAMMITCSLSHVLLVGILLEIHPRVEHLEALVSEGTQPSSVRSASATRRPPFFKRANGKSVYNR